MLSGKKTIIRSIQIDVVAVLKWCPPDIGKIRVDSIIMAPPGGYFFPMYTNSSPDSKSSFLASDLSLARLFQT